MAPAPSPTSQHERQRPRTTTTLLCCLLQAAPRSGGRRADEVAWFEPAHRVSELTAPFFARRFANMSFSILTPDACVHWDTQAAASHAGRRPGRRARRRTPGGLLAHLLRARSSIPPGWPEMPRYEAARIPGADRPRRGPHSPRRWPPQTPSTPSRRAVARGPRPARRLRRRRPGAASLEEIAAGVQIAAAATSTATPPRACRARARPRAADVRGRAARRPGRPGRPALRRARRPGVRPRAGRGRRAPRPRPTSPTP